MIAYKWIAFCLLAASGLFLIGLITWTLLPAKQHNRNGNAKQPHIIFIFVDDLGWGDLSYHGSAEIPTPNIDAMGLSGITLHNYYSQWICTPSRGSLLTGKYAIRLGLFHYASSAASPSVLPLKHKILPQYLKQLGYATHMIGKWHLGFRKKKYTPTFRGFDTFFGYYNGFVDYYDYTHFVFNKALPNCPMYGADIHNNTGRNTRDLRNFRGEYATRAFTDRAVDIIMNHDTSKPLFLYLSHLAVHTGNQMYANEAPIETAMKFPYIPSLQRRNFAGMVSEMDDSVGAVFEALNDMDMLSNSIVAFVSDNGGEYMEFGGVANNYPLRGKKWTLWEGGCRVPAMLWSPLFKLKNQRVSQQMMHVTDWLPTLYSAAGGNVTDLGESDGHDLWDALLNDSPSPREEFLYNFDTVQPISAYRSGNFKVINGSTPDDYTGWYGHPGTVYVEQPKSMYDHVFRNGSVVEDVLKKTGYWLAQNPDEWYEQNTVVCEQPPPASVCDGTEKPCLFNVTADPCEYHDLADQFPDIVESLMSKIEEYASAIVPQQQILSDPRGDPMCHHFLYVPWMDPEHYVDCHPDGYCYKNNTDFN